MVAARAPGAVPGEVINPGLVALVELGLEQVAISSREVCVDLVRFSGDIHQRGSSIVVVGGALILPREAKTHRVVLASRDSGLHADRADDVLHAFTEGHVAQFGDGAVWLKRDDADARELGDEHGAILHPALDLHHLDRQRRCRPAPRRHHRT